MLYEKAHAYGDEIGRKDESQPTVPLEQVVSARERRVSKVEAPAVHETCRKGQRPAPFALQASV